MRAIAEAVTAALGQLGGAPACVALSGGIDSTVLVHALATAGAPALRAVYVDHGLDPRAADWGRQCQRLCAGLGVPFGALVVRVDPAGEEGPEAAARRVRYRALVGQLTPDEALLTAHHRDDQAETVLLNLLRGSGVAGLAGIPTGAWLDGHRVLRPLLGVSRAALADYARSAGLEWVEDPSNDDLRMDRNFLRHEVLPRLATRWPSVRATLSRSARLCAEAQDLLDELAAADLRRLRRGAALEVARLRALAGPRQRNAVRWLCRRELGSAPPDRRLREGLAQILDAAADRHPVLGWAGGEIRRYRGRLYVLRACGAPPSGPAGVLPARAGATLELGPGAGRLRLVRARGQGIAASRVGTGLCVGFRTGGERLRPAGAAHHREVKKLLQERGVVPWMRSRIPLLWSDDRLVAVGHLWVAAEFAANAAEPGLRVKWEDHPPLE
jgi:tRNA(Ile)-lysidine synthase